MCRDETTPGLVVGLLTGLKDALVLGWYSGLRPGFSREQLSGPDMGSRQGLEGRIPPQSGRLLWSKARQTCEQSSSLGW